MDEREVDFMEEYVKSLHAPLPEEAYEDEGSYVYEYCHPGMYANRTSVKHFKDSDEDKFVLGKEYGALGCDERIRFSVIIDEYSEYEGENIALGGKRFSYSLYFDGIFRGKMMVIAIPSFNRRDVPAAKLGGQLFYMLDAGFEPYPLCETSTLLSLRDMTMYDDNPLCYWDNLYVPEKERGKGFAELLMRNAMIEHGENNIHDFGQDILFLSAWDSRPVNVGEKNSKKQDALNAFYRRFLENLGFQCRVLERNGFIATNN